MIAKRARLSGKEFHSGRYETVSTPYFSLRKKVNGEKRNKIGIVAGSAVDKSAVKRNFLKRQGKSILMELQNGGNDILLVFTHKIKTITKREFRKKIREAASRLGMK